MWKCRCTDIPLVTATNAKLTQKSQLNWLNLDSFIFVSNSPMQHATTTKIKDLIFSTKSQSPWKNSNHFPT